MSSTTVLRVAPLAVEGDDISTISSNLPPPQPRHPHPSIPNNTQPRVLSFTLQIHLPQNHTSDSHTLTSAQVVVSTSHKANEILLARTSRILLASRSRRFQERRRETLLADVGIDVFAVRRRWWRGFFALLVRCGLV